MKMQVPDPISTDHTSRDNQVPSSFRTLIAWAAITMAVVFAVAITQVSNRSEMISPQMTSATSVYLGKYLVGSAEFSPTSKAQLRSSIDTASGPVQLRLQNIIVLADISGAEAARGRLDSVNEKMDAEDAAAKSEDRQSRVTEQDRDLHRILSSLYAEGVTPDEAVKSLPAVDKQKLTEDMGWFGALALAPAEGDEAAREKVIGPAVSVAIGTIFGVMVLFAVALIGFVGLVTLIVVVATGRVGSRMREAEANHRLYLETFAIWLVGLTLAQFAMAFAAALVPSELRMVMSFLVFMGSLLALMWPKLHGFTWAEIFRDIGWSMPKPMWATPFYGITGYFLAIPILGVGLAITIALIHLTSSAAAAHEFAVPQGPAHPIVTELMDFNVWRLLQVFLLASVAAPIVEETMFRGVFYRYLREATRARRVWLSIVIATVVNSFIFAAIHPQGVVSIPVLMSLAVAFTLARELLDSIVPSMLMHGISNGITLSVAVMIFGS